MPTVPRLPEPLTEDGLRSLMRARAYWDLKHPQLSLYHHLVRTGFALLYPGSGKTDGIGRIIRPEPRSPGEVASQVAVINREMAQLERVLDSEASPAHDGEFDERSSGTSEIHVQSHTRDGGKTEVADYWRAAPGQGGGDDRSDNSTGSNTEDDAGANDNGDQRNEDYPPGGPPLESPRIRGRDGYARSSDYGDPRGKDKHGNEKFHKGIDLVTEPGEMIRSPVAGTVLPPYDPYGSDPKLRGKLSAVQIKTDDGHVVEILYVDPQPSGLKPGDRVEIGMPIGKAQDLAPVYPPRKSGIMTNHIDVRIKRNGIYKDPKPLVFGRQR